VILVLQASILEVSGNDNDHGTHMSMIFQGNTKYLSLKVHVKCKPT